MKILPRIHLQTGKNRLNFEPRSAKLTVLNNKLLRILQYKPIRTHSYELYQTYFTLPVQLLHKYQILIFMHNYIYYRTKLPVVFSAYFVIIADDASDDDDDDDDDDMHVCLCWLS